MSIHDTTEQPETYHVPERGPTRPSATKPLMIFAAVIGGLILIGVVVSAVFSSAISFGRGSATITADTSGITAVNLGANASQFTLEFGDVDEAMLEANGVRANDWQLQRVGDELLVTAPNHWFNWCIFNCSFEDSHVTLTLPEDLNDGSLDADLELSAGQLIADGQFDQLEIDVGAGEVRVNGAASSVDADVSAGSTHLNLVDVQTARFDVSAGRLIGELSGTPPESVEGDVSAGRLDLTLPATEYDVTSDVSAGDLDNSLETSSSSDNRISVDVSAGDAILRPGDADQQ